LEGLRTEGEVDLTNDDIEQHAMERAHTGMAHHIAHNPPGQLATSFYQNVMARACHPNGYGWSNSTNSNMRQNNAHQCAINTRIHDAAAPRQEFVNSEMSEESGFDPEELQMAMNQSVIKD
jgi:ABC-type phosphate transport system ATPase subunit